MARFLATIGYEQATPATLIAALKKARVDTLIDVRAVPLSRRPGFSKNVLKGHLEQAGVAYVGLKGLGTPKAGRDAAKAGRVGEMHRIFKQHMKTVEAQEDLDRAIHLVCEHRCCLLCHERDACICHRLLVAEDIGARVAVRVVHLLVEVV